jgi:hypothetical protein
LLGQYTLDDTAGTTNGLEVARVGRDDEELGVAERLTGVVVDL